MPDAADGRFGAVASRLRRWRTGRSGSGAALGPYIRPYRRTLLGAAALSVGQTAFELAQPWPLALALDYAVGRRRLTGVLAPVGSLTPVTFALAAAVASVAIVGLGGVAGYLVEYLSGAAGERIGSDVRVGVFGRLQRLALTFHDRNRTGDLVERLTSDV